MALANVNDKREYPVRLFWYCRHIIVKLAKKKQPQRESFQFTSNRFLPYHFSSYSNLNKKSNNNNNNKNSYYRNTKFTNLIYDVVWVKSNYLKSQVHMRRVGTMRSLQIVYCCTCRVILKGIISNHSRTNMSFHKKLYIYSGEEW